MKVMMRKLKKAWRSYLDRLAEANRKAFGGRPLDCCNLNSSKSSKKTD